MAVQRRTLLKGLGVVGGIAAVEAAGLVALSRGPLRGTAEAEVKDKEPSRQWGVVVDMRRCDGCRECTEACQAAHYLPHDQEWIKVYEVEEHGARYFMPRLCMQCENPPCLKVCPVGATFKNENGVILVDQGRCIGCRLCMAACPYNARYFNFADPPKPPPGFDNPMPEFPVPQRRGTVGKCILCVHYTRDGRLPACIEACRMDALYLVDYNSQVMVNRSGESYEVEQYLRDNDAFRLKEEMNTSPRVWYVAGHGQMLGERRHG